jgi:predicted secreted protein
VQGHVVIKVIQTGILNAVVSGLFFDTPGAPPPPSVVMTKPTEGATYLAPATIPLEAVPTAQAGVKRVDFYSGNQVIGTVPFPGPYAATWSNVPAGSYTLKAQVIDNNNVSADSPVVHVTVNSPGGGGTATFVGTDTTTQGTWKGVYGTDGYHVINDTVNYPAYAQVTPSGQLNYTWAASTSEVRALQKANAADRIAATWYGGTFTIDVNLTDGNPHRLSLYLLDWDSFGRAETIEFRDGASNALLNSQSANTFRNGKYLTWTVQGHVVIKVIQTGILNAVVSGLFFDHP